MEELIFREMLSFSQFELPLLLVVIFWALSPIDCIFLFSNQASKDDKIRLGLRVGSRLFCVALLLAVGYLSYAIEARNGTSFMDVRSFGVIALSILLLGGAVELFIGWISISEPAFELSARKRTTAATLKILSFCVLFVTCLSLVPSAHKLESERIATVIQENSTADRIVGFAESGVEAIYLEAEKQFTTFHLVDNSGNRQHLAIESSSSEADLAIKVLRCDRGPAACLQDSYELRAFILTDGFICPENAEEPISVVRIDEEWLKQLPFFQRG